MYHPCDVTAPTNTAEHRLYQACDCNLTCCPHWLQAEAERSYTTWVSPVSSLPEQPVLKYGPRPWLREMTPVVPVAKNLSLAPWRPRQQRARDGI